MKRRSILHVANFGWLGTYGQWGEAAGGAWGYSLGGYKKLTGSSKLCLTESTDTGNPHPNPLPEQGEGGGREDTATLTKEIAIRVQWAVHLRA
jgi:hypothetical protein